MAASPLIDFDGVATSVEFDLAAGVPANVALCDYKNDGVVSVQSKDHLGRFWEWGRIAANERVSFGITGPGTFRVVRISGTCGAYRA